MKVTVHSQIEGKQSGESATVDAERGRWLIDNGYAVADGTTAEPAAETAEKAPAPKKRSSK